MIEIEGVVKYNNVDHENIDFERNISIAEINAWRTLLFKLKLIGQIKGRYGGYGFGNISQRIYQPNSENVQFIISGTQTGGDEVLSRRQYCHVLETNTNKNSICSIGETQPSSEALTHASVYQQDDNIGTVIHIHSPEIWNNTQQLGIAYTAKNIAYGTPEMANEVKRLLKGQKLKEEKIFSMLGHEDGIIAFSNIMEEAALLLVKYYSKAIGLDQNC